MSTKRPTHPAAVCRMTARDIPQELIRNAKRRARARREALDRAVMLADAIGALAGLGVLAGLRAFYH